MMSFQDTLSHCTKNLTALFGRLVSATPPSVFWGFAPRSNRWKGSIAMAPPVGGAECWWPTAGELPKKSESTPSAFLGVAAQ